MVPVVFASRVEWEMKTMRKLENKRPDGAIPSWLKNADRSLWTQYNVSTEPPLDEVLDDPIVKALAASDHVSRSELDKLVKIIRDYRATR